MESDYAMEAIKNQEMEPVVIRHTATESNVSHIAATKKAFYKKLNKSMHRQGKRKSVQDNFTTSHPLGTANPKMALLSGYYSQAVQQNSRSHQK